MSRGKPRPFGVICTACQPAVRKRFGSELARRQWNVEHVAAFHAGRQRSRNRRYLLLWEQPELGAGGPQWVSEPGTTFKSESSRHCGRTCCR